VRVVAVGYDAGTAANFSPSGYGDTYVPVVPIRVIGGAKVAGGGSVALAVAGTHAIPATASAVALDVTVTHPASAGDFVAIHGLTRPSSTFAGAYWATGQQVTALAFVPNEAATSLWNEGRGAASFTVDVVGYYVHPAATGAFLPQPAPARILKVTLAAGHSVKLAVAGKNGVPAAGTTAVQVNLTTSGAAASGTITGYADGTARPADPVLSYQAAATDAGAALIAVGKDGAIDLYNGGGRPVTLDVDLAGSYYTYS
jgi:hypothetical protein